MNNKQRLQSYCANRGFTLVELMLAMALGIFLIAGVSTVYISSKQTYKVRDQTSELDENARVALRALKHHIEHAGYASTTGMLVPNYVIPGGTVIASSNCADGTPNIVNTAVINTTVDRDASAGGDTIGVIYMADRQLNADCSGTTMVPTREQCLPPASANRTASFVYNSFSVGSTRTNSMGDDVPALRCGGSLNNNLQPWAEGIENIQFQYGIDNNGDGAVDNYWSADAVDAGGVWENIITVRVGLLVRSIDPVFEQAVAESYQVLDQVIGTTDRYRRNVYTTTIRLKNVARRI
ncbi:MAG: PilW family protein [Thiolinea sp.]